MDDKVYDIIIEFIKAVNWIFRLKFAYFDVKNRP